MSPEKAQKAQTENSFDHVIRIQYFTDPLCCWSWAMENHLQKLLQAHGSGIDINYRMGGLLKNWEHYHDNLNAVYTPTQMGPLWMYAGQTTAVNIDASLWINDPPNSSYPACIAVKCMQLQGNEAGRDYLFRLRKAVMVQNLNISRDEVLLEIADQTVQNNSHLSMEQFEHDRQQGKGQEIFEVDLAHKKRWGITRLPTMLMQCAGTTIGLTGYRRFDQLAEAIKFLQQAKPVRQHESELK